MKKREQNPAKPTPTSAEDRGDKTKAIIESLLRQKKPIVTDAELKAMITAGRA